MRVLVMTVVHHPEDARILHRQIRALVDAGHEVVHAAPFGAFGERPRPWVTGIELPRALGRNRVPAMWAARRRLARMRGEVDIVLVHDPELVLAVVGMRDHPPTVWDVHEDTAAALSAKPWLPLAARPLARMAIRTTESLAERRLHLLLAEHAYADRFGRAHPVVPNETIVPKKVPPPGDDRVVYVGWLGRARGSDELIETGRLLAPHGIRVDLIGYADARARPALRAATRDGLVRWHGFVPNDEALRRLEGALAGLSLLHNEPNYRHSLPTKVIEYMARGLPVITTPSPQAVALVERYQSGIVVPWRDPAAVARAVLSLRDDQAQREALGLRGHAATWEHHNWPRSAAAFVAQMETWAGVSLRS